ncbi:MAG: hypothetical protein OHK0052_04750 [Anaerolineales bacterium]
MEERLQKILAQAGLGSRRGCEELIRAGRVLVNGQTATLGMKANPQTDQIQVDGEPLKTGGAPVYILLNKPRGVLSAAYSPEGRQTVVDLVNIPTRVYPVGRLDIDSEGLILLTNDGELTNKLTHPRYEHEKEYRVLVGRRPDEEQLQAWRRGVVLEDGFRTSPADVRLDKITGEVAWLTVILKEGHKRQIREMGASTGLPVLRIIRVRMGNLQLGTLKSKDWRYLTAEEISALKNPTAPNKTPATARKPSGLRAPYQNRRERAEDEERRENRPPRKPFGKLRQRNDNEERAPRQEGYRPRRERAEDEERRENRPAHKPFGKRDTPGGSRPPRRPENRGKPTGGAHKPTNKRKP